MKKIFILILMSSIIFAQTSFAKDYSDYPQRYWDLDKTHWAYEYISELTDKNVINGYEDGSFKPEHTVLRSEWAKMMCTAGGLQLKSAEEIFMYENETDFDEYDWFADYMVTAMPYLNCYLADDYPYEQYKPNQAASREDVTVSLVKLKGYDVENVDYSYITGFSDLNSISNSVKKYIAAAIEKGLITGYEDNTFRAQDTLTRAEAAALLCRAFQLGNDNKVSAENKPDITQNDNSENKPTPTGKPERTPKPTSVPEVTSTPVSDAKPTAVPEPTVSPKPFVMDTLVKADVTPLDGSYNYRAFYTQDEADNLYYYDNSTSDIVKINMLTRKSQVIANAKELAVEFEGNEYCSIELGGIFYDKYADTLAVYGSFEAGKRSFENEAERFYCIVELDTKKVVSFDDMVIGINYGLGPEAYITHSISDYTFYGTLENGDYVANICNSSESTDYIISRESFQRELLGGKHSHFYPPYCEYNGEIYFISMEGYLSTLAHNWTDSDVRVSEMPFRGIAHGYAYVLVDNAFGAFTLGGDQDVVIPFEDIEIADNKGFKRENINMILMATKNKDIVFYDTWNKSFRIVSNNENAEQY